MDRGEMGGEGWLSIPAKRWITVFAMRGDMSLTRTVLSIAEGRGPLVA
jgi:hypothetical protein